MSTTDPRGCGSYPGNEGAGSWKREAGERKGVIEFSRAKSSLVQDKRGNQLDRGK